MLPFKSIQSLYIYWSSKTWKWIIWWEYMANVPDSPTDYSLTFWLAYCWGTQILWLCLMLFLFVIICDSSSLWLVKLELFLILCWSSLKALYHISWHCTWYLSPYCPNQFRFLVYISYPWHGSNYYSSFIIKLQIWTTYSHFHFSTLFIWTH